MKYILILPFFIFLSFGNNKSLDSIRDFKLLEGSWKGQLTYLDYTSNKKVVIPADLIVQRIPGMNKWYFKNMYPDEPHANSVDTVYISDDGNRINEEIVMHRRKQKGLATIVTLKKVNYNDVIRNYRYTYIIGRKTFSMKKEEKHPDREDYLVRNIYEFERE